MERKLGSVYPMWEETWCVEDEHKVFRLRLCGHDAGADIVIMSCPFGYGANEEAWNGANFGRAQSVEQIAAMYAWLRSKANGNAEGEE